MVLAAGPQSASLGAADHEHSFVASMYASQSTSLVKHLSRRLKSVDEAFEVAQEAWLRLMNHDAPEGLDNARAFLFQTANNLVVDRARHAAVEQRYLDAQTTHALHTVGPTADEQYQAREDLETMMRALDTLPANTRDAFLLHRVAGLPYLEIARILNVSASMVEKHIIRALKALRGAIGSTG